MAGALFGLDRRSFFANQISSNTSEEISNTRREVRLEILALVFLTKKIGAICEAKGRKAGRYKVLTVLLWFGCEAAGAVVGIITIGGEGTIVYVYALIGAAVGAAISFLIAKNLEPAPPSPPSAPSTQ